MDSQNQNAQTPPPADPPAIDPPAADPPKADPPASNYYPQIKIERNAKPNRLYAVPFFGFFIKFIMLIPIFIELWLLSIAIFIIVMLVNPFIVLFTGKYWKTAYDLASGMMRLGSKVSFFFMGVTDKYPGFSLSNAPYTFNIAYPASSNRLFAVPLLGILIRIVLLIPFYVVSSVFSYASGIATFFTFAPVLFMGNYPETTHEINVDSVRLSQAMSAYVYGLSDKYPSFKVSWNHKTMKIVLIVLGSLMFLLYTINSLTPKPTPTKTELSPTPTGIELPQY